MKSINIVECKNEDDLKEIAKKLKPFLPDSVIKVKSAEFGEEVV